MIWIIVIIIFILFIFVITHKQNKKEYFHWDPLFVGKTSLDCYNETIKNCMKYANCGLCHNNGQLKCQPGDENGPFFNNDCNKWTYTNYYDKSISTTLPWSFYYPDYEIMWPSPVVVGTL